MSGIDIAIIVIMGLFTIMIFTYVSSISGKVDDFMDKINDMEKDIHDFEKMVKLELSDNYKLWEIDDKFNAKTYQIHDIRERLDKMKKTQNGNYNELVHKYEHINDRLDLLSEKINRINCDIKSLKNIEQIQKVNKLLKIIKEYERL